MPPKSSEGQQPKLSKHEIDAITERLRKGEFLDDHWRHRLFQEAKEAELAYAGKQNRSAVLADTMAVPLQALKRFGTSDDDSWPNKLIFGDNLQVLKTLLAMKEQDELLNADGTPGVRLCYIDPPFATKREFRGKKGQLAYRDRVEGAEFIEFLRKRLIFIHELLSDDGALYMHLDTKKVHSMKVLLDEIFGPQNFRSEIIWKRSHAHNDTAQGVAQHGRIHDTILFYSKSEKWIWNPMYTVYDEAYSESEYRHVASDGRRYKQTDLSAAKPGGDTSFLWHVKRREVPKGDPPEPWVADVEGEWENPVKGWEYHAVRPYKGRYWGYSYDNMLDFHRQGLLHHRKTGMPRLIQFADEMPGVSLQDLWTDIPPIGSSADEREDYPTQKPLALIERIIASSSNPGDVCLDCFAGSGTALVAAEALGRRWIGIDCGKLAIYTAQRRLLAHEGKAVDNHDLQPFELCHAGLYDNTLLEELPLPKYEDFVLQLFGCSPGPHKLGHVPMVGTRKGGPVHLFPFNKTDALMGREYVESLHQRIKSKVSGEVYVITPVSACDPSLFEDVITLDENTYFILRVPYSVIEALHGRNFELLPQPGSFKELNDAIDSFGFDFVELPETELRYTHAEDALSIEIREFRRGGLDPDDLDQLEDAGRDDLAMVMIDPDYDGEVFRLMEYRFADALAESGWSFELDLTRAGRRLLIIYMDTHGNERREVVELSKLNMKKPRSRATPRGAKTKA